MRILGGRSPTLGSKSGPRLAMADVGSQTKMATEPRDVSGEAGWSKGDIVELVALLVSIPAAIVAGFMLATYFRRSSQGREGESLFLQDGRPQRPLGASSASHTVWLMLCLEGEDQ